LHRAARDAYPLGMRHVLAGLVVAAGLAGCSKAPSSEQCTQALDHLIDLEALAAGGGKGLSEEQKADVTKQKANISEAQRTQFMDACVKKTPRSVVECTLSAQTLDDAGKCDEK
jgi:hypothetical protein